jgi:Ni/Fe-hydrogenase 1 B-type cytochrome subunit
MEVIPVHTYRLLSSGVRFCHWIWATCIVVLFVTGLYIGNPMFIGTQGIEPAVAVTNILSMESIRSLHFITAFIFISCLLLRTYLFFTYSGNRLFPNFFTRQYWRGLGEMIAYYGFWRSHHHTYLRNPLAATSYAAIYLLMLLEAITGFTMYTMIRPTAFLSSIFAPVIGWLGNEYGVHLLHHIIAWIFMVFLLVHVYMVIYDDVVEKTGELSSIVSGRKYFKDKPVDTKDSLIE